MLSRNFSSLFEIKQRDISVPGDAVVIGTLPSVVKVFAGIKHF